MLIDEFSRAQEAKISGEDLDLASYEVFEAQLVELAITKMEPVGERILSRNSYFLWFTIVAHECYLQIFYCY